MLLKAALTIGFLWSVALIVVGWFVSRRREKAAFHFWFALIAAEAARWSLTAFLIQNVGKPMYLSGSFVPYQIGGLYGGMGVMGIVLGVGLFFWRREKSFWPGGYYTLSSGFGILALWVAWLLLI